LWVSDVSGTGLHRLADLTGECARWSPKGDQILYCAGPELRIARQDGSDSRPLTPLNGIALQAAWSPDGRLIRFTVLAKNTHMLWQVAADGSGLHRLFPQWSDRPQQGGVWTPDSRCFVF